MDIVSLYVSEMPDYSKGKIYKICSDDPDITEVYIGSSVQDLHIRMSGHIWDFKNKTNQCPSRKLFEKYGVEPFCIKLIENYPCKSKKELLIREQHYMDIYQGVNICKAHITKEQLKAYQSQYHKDNHEKIYKKKTEWYANNPEKIKASNERNRPAILARKKVYVANHKEEKIAYDKERQKIKIMCECGQQIALANKAKHIKTKRHITLMEALSLQEHQAHAPTSE